MYEAQVVTNSPEMDFAISSLLGPPMQLSTEQFHSPSQNENYANISEYHPPLNMVLDETISSEQSNYSVAKCDASLEDGCHIGATSNSFVPISSDIYQQPDNTIHTSSVSYETNTKWFEDDIDFSKILLCCNSEDDGGAIEVDGFNLAFSENTFFGNDEYAPTGFIEPGKLSNIEVATTELSNSSCDTTNDGCDLLTSQQNANETADAGAADVTMAIAENMESTVVIQGQASSASSVSQLNCLYCSKTFRYSSRLKRHMTTHQNKQYPCHICHKYFSRIDVMEVHIARTHYKTNLKQAGKGVSEY